MKMAKNAILRKMKRILALAAICAALCTGCRDAGHHGEAEHGHETAHEHDHEHGHGHGHDHGHGHEAVQHITIYSSEYEIFVASEPLVKGEAATLLTHISVIPGFKPLKDGKVSASLYAGGTVSSSEAAPSPTEGIYKVRLTPASEGRASLTFNINGTVLGTEVTVYHCEHDAEEDLEGEPSAGGNRVSFTKEQSWKIDFATEPLRREALGEVISCVGQILPSQSETHSVIAKASGIVTIAGGSLLAGSPVRKGAPLLYIGSDGLADSNMDVRYIEARSEYERAEGEYSRKKTLAENKIVSASELSRAKAEYESARAAFENLESNYREGRFSATSDIDGYISEVFVSNGEYVEAGQALASVCGKRRLLVEAKLQAKYYAALSSGVAEANFRFSGNGRVWSLDELDGRVASVGQSVSSDDPLLPVSFEISNKAGLLPGTFADIRIKTRGSAEALTVASGAIVEEMGNYFVYKQITPELFEKVQVGVGASDGLRTIITSGLDGSERVVTRGAVIVKLAQAAGGLDAHAGHVH